MAGLGLVAVPEHALLAARREHEQHPRAVDARVLEAVPNASRNEDEVAGAGYEGVGAVQEFELTGEDVERLVAPGMSVGDRPAARRQVASISPSEPLVESADALIV
jgi:hypothetical protein